MSTAAHRAAQARYSRVAPLIAEFDDDETDEDEGDGFMDDHAYEPKLQRQPRAQAAAQSKIKAQKESDAAELRRASGSADSLEEDAEADPRRMLAELARGRLVD